MVPFMGTVTCWLPQRYAVVRFGTSRQQSELRERVHFAQVVPNVIRDYVSKFRARTAELNLERANVAQLKEELDEEKKKNQDGQKMLEEVTQENLRLLEQLSIKESLIGLLKSSDEDDAEESKDELVVADAEGPSDAKRARLKDVYITSTVTLPEDIWLGILKTSLDSPYSFVFSVYNQIVPLDTRRVLTASNKKPNTATLVILHEAVAMQRAKLHEKLEDNPELCGLLKHWSLVKCSAASLDNALLKRICRASF